MAQSQVTISNNAAGRGSASRSDGKRAEIRAAATRLFAAKGFEATSVKDLAAALDMTPANLYNYYKSKQLLLSDVLHVEMRESVRLHEDICRSDADPVQRLRAFAMGLILVDLRNPVAAFAVSKGIDLLPRRERRSLASLMERIRECWIQTINEGVRQKLMSTSDTKLAAIQALTMCTFVSSWYHDGGEWSHLDVARFTSDACLRMVGAAPAARESLPKSVAHLVEGVA